MSPVQRVFRGIASSVESELQLHNNKQTPAAMTTKMHDDDLRVWSMAAKMVVNDIDASPAVEIKKKGVSFAKSIKVRIVPSLSDLRDDEYEAIWYSEDESQRFQADVVRTIKAARLPRSGSRTSTALENGGLCLRGLEHMARLEELRRRKSVKAEVVRAVLDEQSHQRRMSEAGDICDPEEQEAMRLKLRLASSRISSNSTILALEAGKADAAFVRRELALAAARSLAAARRSASAIASTAKTRRAVPSLHRHSNGGKNIYGLIDVLGRAVEVSSSSSSLSTSKSQSSPPPRPTKVGATTGGGSTGISNGPPHQQRALVFKQGGRPQQILENLAPNRVG